MVLTVTVQFRRLPCLPEESFMLKWFFVLEVRVLYSALFNCQSLLITDFLELSSTTVTTQTHRLSTYSQQVNYVFLKMSIKLSL